MKLLIFGGTTEGRELAESFYKNCHEVTLAVATEYGGSLVKQETGIHVHTGRLALQEMVDFIKNQRFDWIIDATHPYADLVTANIRAACSATKSQYIRLVRETQTKDEDVLYVSNTEEAVSYLQGTRGSIFLTTGSKSLESFTKIPEFSERIFLRVIPMMESLEKALNLGYQPSHIICMQGPFSVGLNQEMLKMTAASYLVTKDSGEVGGFSEKLAAARALSCKVIVISRPLEERGYTKEEMMKVFHLK